MLNWIPGLKPLKIGSVDIGFPAIQAPLSGYSDRPQRHITRNLYETALAFGIYDYLPSALRQSIVGAAATTAEVMLDQFILSVKKSVKVNRYLGLEESDHPCGAQIMGALPEDFAPAALRLVDCGFDWIDLNFACPVKKVLGRKRGGYLMTEPQTALEMIARTRDALPDRIPLTVKLRKGYDDACESTDEFYKILEGAFNLGAAAVAIHGRTVLQRYSGTADWDFIAEAKKNVGDKTILGCGDLFDATVCIRRIQETGIDGVCIARGAIGNPWIFPAFNALAIGLPAPPAPSLAEQAAVLNEHFRRVGELYGEKFACTMIRKFAIKQAALHPAAEELRKRFAVIRNQREWVAVLEEYYQNNQ